MAAGPVLGVSAIVRRGGEILLVRRGRDPYRGAWSLPGGTVHGGEPLAAALRREVSEETGLGVDVGEIAALREEISGAGHFVIVVFHARATKGLLRAGDDAAETRWTAVDELNRLNTTPGLVDALRQAGVIGHPQGEGRLR